MRQIFLPLLKIALLLTIFVASLGAISSVLPAPKPHDFANIDAPSLWTTHPVKVDRSAQQFERLPSRNARREEARQIAQATSDDGQEAGVIDAGQESFETAAVDHTLVTSAVPASMDADSHAAVDWCRNHYKSYRASDNSYQPYNGPRRQCQSQVASTAQNEALVGEEATADDNDMHGQWCAACAEGARLVRAQR